MSFRRVTVAHALPTRAGTRTQNMYPHNLTMIDSTKALSIKLYQGGSARDVAIVS
jgi:hypothetical protein